MRNTRVLLLAATGFLFALTTLAAAQSDYPNRPIRLIIPFPAGGSNDIVGRAIATQMGERLGKQIVVDNRTGAGGVVGTELASHAPAASTTAAMAEKCKRSRSLAGRLLRRSTTGRAERTCSGSRVQTSM